MNSNNLNLHKTPATDSTTECTNCNSAVDHPVLLHHVRHRGHYRRLCTSCVLKLHPGSFCPTCFELIDLSTPTHLRVSCQKCNSISHSTCVPGSAECVSYACPPCAGPGFSFFDLEKRSAENGDVRVIDKRAAAVLLCAARIAAVSMNKAMGFTRSEAERRVREATLSKKRAREALEHVASLAAKEKESKGSSSVLIQGKEKASMISNGADVAGSQAKHSRVESKAKVSTPIVGSSSAVAPRDKERAKREPKVKYDVKGSPSIPGKTMPAKEEKPENNSILKKCNADVEKGKNGMLPSPTPLEGLGPYKGDTSSHVTQAEKGKDGIKSLHNLAKGLPPPEKAGYSHNAVAEKGKDGIKLPPNPVVERKLSPKQVNVDAEKPKSGLLPSNPVEEMKLTPPNQNAPPHNVEAEKVNKVMSPPAPAEETTGNRNVEIEKAKNGLLPPFHAKEDKLPPPVKGIDTDVVEIEMVGNEALPPNPVEDHQPLLQESSVNPNLVPEKASNALLPPRPVEETKLSPKEGSGNDSAEPTKGDSVISPPHPISDGTVEGNKAPNTVSASCDMMEDDTTSK